MQSEETTFRLEHQGQLSLLFQSCGNPGGIPLFVPMTIVLVVHQFPVPDLLALVNLPEDDGTIFRPPQTVTLRSMPHLLLSEITLRYQRTAEYGIGTNSPVNQILTVFLWLA